MTRMYVRKTVPVPPKHHQLRLRLSLLLLVCSVSIASLTLGVVSALTAPVIPQTAESDPITIQKLLIYEVKQGKNSLPQQPVEYVTLYNPNDYDISIAGWTLEYAKPGFAATRCSDGDWFADGTNAYIKRTQISGVGSAGSYSTTVGANSLSAPIPLSINDSAAGSIHLVDQTKTVHSLTGWKFTSTNPPCSETAAAASLSADKSLVRYLQCDHDIPINSDDNSQDFFIADSVSNGSITIQRPATCADPPTENPAGNNQLSCAGIKLSEALPNPAGADSGHEFIELYNPTQEVVPLTNCQLQYQEQDASNPKIFDLAGIADLQPNSYRALYDTETSITLTNSKAGTIWLLSTLAASNPIELSSLQFPAGLGDDISWAYDMASQTWQTSYAATPGAANTIVTSEPCPTDQARNPETNRCITITDSTATSSPAVKTTAAVPCAANQTRNPETNRCRLNTTTASTVSNPTACKPGQARNPETNRCKTVAANASTTKACPSGQERNSATNRCRKTAGDTSNVAQLSNVHDNASQSAKTHKNYWLIAAVLLGIAVAYAVYEWRQEIAEIIKNRIPKVAKLAGTKS